ncbi:predicted protein [Naegleria gruberi]|uniref:Predicted protein n=1 Tax=Naegleria gruberi TaxID=5762 RepID=D2W0V5_NAEGR|nr:uncharacterized protein NAEGRDRAFT_53821 [Naegleria gruberi]EFC37247.1 predicted protein [Naegleria gruberi]|eukprot:XP_002669991.1 predicted protein [Naegleria gruberi strain NEG-M]
MNISHTAILFLLLLLLLLTTVTTLNAFVPLEIGPNLYEFGVAVNKGSTRGVVVTKCGPIGKQFDCILSLLMDFTESTSFTMFAMLVINALSGESTSVEIPGNPLGGVIASNYASLLEDREKRFYYAHFGATFYQFDAQLMNFTFYQRTHNGMAMALTMDDYGQIWGGTYPKCGVFSFNPNNTLLKDYGFVYNQTWDMYPRSIASDDLGFIYIGIAFTKSQFIALNPKTGQYYPLIDEVNRLDGTGVLYRDLDGAVYGNQGGSSIVYKMYNGTMISNVTKKKTAKVYLAGSQDYIYRYFQSGNFLQDFNAVDKTFVIKLSNGTLLNRDFTYSCRGANIMDMVATPDRNLLIGATSFPMTMFSLNGNPVQSLQNNPALDQWNTIKSVPYDSNIWIGTYPEGRLLSYSPSKPYVYTEIGNNRTNPVFIGTSSPHVNRPSCVLIHPNMEHVLMSGKPAYGKTGGGLLIHNRKLQNVIVLNHTQLIPYHSIYSMSSMKSSNSIIICGTTTDPGTGGQQIATESELFLFDLSTLNVLKRFKPFKNVGHYYELFNCPENDLIYGYTDTRIFFVYNPLTDSIIHNRTIDRIFVEQGPHSIVSHPKTNETFITSSTGLYKINPVNFSFILIFKPNKLLMFNAVILNDGFYYFRAGTEVYGYKLFNATFIDPVNSVIGMKSSVNPMKSGDRTVALSVGVANKFTLLIILLCLTFVQYLILA